MKIIVFEAEEWERHAFEQLKTGHEIEFVNELLNMDNVKKYADAEVVSPFIYSDLSADVLRHLGRLKLISTRSTGFDHIDLEYCKGNGITVCSCPMCRSRN
ncbi:MAG: hypothetical protein AB1390_11655 [Nitrospirota bacterium]